MTHSLLPKNASTLEHAYERAFLEILNDADAPFPGLLNPYESPVPFLPYLANDRGVEEWDSADDNDKKRRTIAAAWPTQRLAGTGKAIITTLQALNFSATIVPWHKEKDRAQPFSLRIEAHTGEMLDDVKSNRLFRRIHAVKAERDTLSISMLHKSSMNVYLATSVASGISTKVSPRVSFQLKKSAISIACFQHLSSRYNIKVMQNKMNISQSEIFYSATCYVHQHLTVRSL
jgi:phage tail P2-like protein